jgi:putative SOS response-associated peptidase YedK
MVLAEINDRMSVILVPNDYVRWLGEEPDPRDLMQPFPRHSRGETSHDATKAAIRRIRLGSARNGA